MTTLADCHVHLDHFDMDAAEIEEALASSGISCALTAGMDLPSSRKAVALAARSPRVMGAIGLHPWNVTSDWVTLQDEFRLLAEDDDCAAISEVGLDSNFVAIPQALQHEVLRWFVRLAQSEGLPMVLHMQVPVGELLELWRGIEGPPPKAAIHGFFGTAADAQALVDHGFWVSLGTASTGFFGGPAVEDDVIRMIPEARLLIDSDAYHPDECLRVPSLTPESRAMIAGTSPVQPAAAHDVAAVLARVRGTSIEDLSSVVSANLQRFLAPRDAGETSDDHSDEKALR